MMPIKQKSQIQIATMHLFSISIPGFHSAEAPTSCPDVPVLIASDSIMFNQMKSL